MKKKARAGVARALELQEGSIKRRASRGGFLDLFGDLVDGCFRDIHVEPRAALLVPQIFGNVHRGCYRSSQ